jgi:uncharacterized cofD-like protein
MLSPATRTPLEHLVELVLNGSDGAYDVTLREQAQLVQRYDASGTRVVILGGGTGLSTVVGGNSAHPDWQERPFVGLKEEFRTLDVVVCTTDDGGSTGRLLERLPMIGIGDLRKSCLSLVRAQALCQRYGVDETRAHQVATWLRYVFNHRFDTQSTDLATLTDPTLAAPEPLRGACPPELAAHLATLGRRVAPGGAGPQIDPAGHCLGNLLLTAAVFEASGTADRPASLDELRRGIDAVAGSVGSTPGRLHAATSTPGQLKFRYANGVEVYGQRKAALARRGFPVETVSAEFVDDPAVSEDLCEAIRQADLIVYAPGSVFSSIIPVLQLDPIVAAVRENRRALKILGANFWIQQGETDLSLHRVGRGFRVSELIEAYDRNVPGGANGLFHVVLCANLEHIPGNILRNYALEGKRPIYLDRSRVEHLGLQPVEATLYSRAQLGHREVVHHDASNFALALRALLYARRFPGTIGGPSLEPARWLHPQGRVSAPGAFHRARTRLLCDQRQHIEQLLARKTFAPAALRETMLELAWQNRDIAPRHLDYFDAVRCVRHAAWQRGTEWDSVLGYYNPTDHCIEVHEQLLDQPDALRENLLVALGESLLGNYIDSRTWVRGPPATCGCRCYEIRLRPPSERRCLLTNQQLGTYLRLARMTPDPGQPLVHRISLNADEGFIPSGLLFGLLYAWYLDGSYGPMMEYEMSLLRWPTASLMPHHAQEQSRRRALVRFFCQEIFGHPSPTPRPPAG